MGSSEVYPRSSGTLTQTGPSKKIPSPQRRSSTHYRCVLGTQGSYRRFQDPNGGSRRTLTTEVRAGTSNEGTKGFCPGDHGEVPHQQSQTDPTSPSHTRTKGRLRSPGTPSFPSDCSFTLWPSEALKTAPTGLPRRPVRLSYPKAHPSPQVLSVRPPDRSPCALPPLDSKPSGRNQLYPSPSLVGTWT